MQYRSISADGHVNEPPTLWTDRLPAKFKDRGPRVIETPKTKGHAWIMEGQKRPSPMGFSSMYSRSSKRFDRASLIDSFKQIKDRGVRYEDVFPGSYDPAARVEEILEDETDAEVIFNGVSTVWNGIKLCPGPGAQPGLLQGLQRLDRRVPGLRARALHLQRHAADDWNRRLPGRAAPLVGLGLRTAQLESYPSGSFFEPTPEDDRFWAAAVELDMADQRPHHVLLPRRRPGIEAQCPGRPRPTRRAKTIGPRRRGGRLPGDPLEDDLVGCLRALPRPEFVGSEVHTGWVPYYLETFDESVMRNRSEWDLPMLPSEYFRRNVSVVYIVDEVGAANRYDIGVGNIMWGPDFPHSSSSWPVDYQLGREILERAGATPSEIERIMWRNAADMYNMPYDEPKAIGAAA